MIPKNYKYKVVGAFNGIRENGSNDPADFVTAINIDLNKDGSVQKRPRFRVWNHLLDTYAFGADTYTWYQTIGATFCSPATSYNPTVLLAAIFKKGATAKTGLFASTGFGFVLVDYTILGTTYKIDMQQFMGSVFLADGVGKICKYTAATGLSRMTGANVPTCTLLCEFKNHLFAAGDPVSPSNLYWSPLGVATGDWDTKDFVVVGDDDEKIVGLEKWQKYLVVIKERSIYILSGSSSADFTVTPAVQNIGTYSAYSVASCDDGLYFLTADKKIAKFDGSLTILSNFIDLKDVAVSGIIKSYSVGTDKEVFFFIGSDGVDGGVIYKYDKIRNDFTQYSVDPLTPFVSFDFPFLSKGILTAGSFEGIVNYVDKKSVMTLVTETTTNASTGFYDEDIGAKNILVTLDTVEVGKDIPTEKKFRLVYIDCACVPKNVTVGVICRGASSTAQALGTGATFARIRRFVRIPTTLGEYAQIYIRDIGAGNFILYQLGACWTEHRQNHNIEVDAGLL